MLKKLKKLTPPYHTLNHQQSRAKQAKYPTSPNQKNSSKSTVDQDPSSITVLAVRNNYKKCNALATFERKRRRRNINIFKGKFCR